MTKAPKTATLVVLSRRGLDSALRHEPADKRIEILRLIGESGSISQAARDAGISYKAAWQAIDTLTNLVGRVLVERAVGGAGGGGARVTAAGHHLLNVANKLSALRVQVLGQLYDAASDPLPADALAHIGVRTSMRNQLPCVISKISPEGLMLRVHLQLAGGASLVSRITKVSAELLGLQPGLSVLALCKATGVVVSAEGIDAGHAASQALKGQSTRISRGTSGDEVSLKLDSGIQLVGFAAAGSGLKIRARVTALIDESAVVIALAP